MLESHSAFRIGFFLRTSRRVVMVFKGRESTQAAPDKGPGGCGQRGLGLHGIFGRACSRVGDGTSMAKNAERLEHVGTASDRKGPETRRHVSEAQSLPNRPNDSGAGRSRHVLRRSDWRHLESSSTKACPEHSPSRWDRRNGGPATDAELLRPDNRDSTATRFKTPVKLPVPWPNATKAAS